MKNFSFFKINFLSLQFCLKQILFIGIFLLQKEFFFLSFAQCGGGGVDLTVQNPSFEGPSQAHVVPSPWQACYGTPDTQPGQWGFTQAPSNGTSYISALQSGTPGAYQEGASQQLSSCMVAGTTYTFSLDLAFSNVYNTAEPIDCYGSLQIWGGNSMCGKNETLWQSGVITNTSWQTYTITLTPTQNWCYISMAPYHITNCSGYINIMIDNLSPISAPGPGLQATVNSDISCSQTINGEISCPADSIILSGLFNGSPVYANILTDSTWSKNVVYPSGSAGTQSIEITAYTQNGDTLVDTLTFNLVEITPDFSPTNVCDGTPINFTNTSTITSGAIATYQWDFGDGSGTSSLQNPSYTYASPGLYSVQLTVTSDLGCIDSITKTVRVFDKPVADFSVPNVCLNVQSSFTNQSSIASGTLTAASWNFGDGTGTSALPNPFYTYPAVGTYNVSLIVTSDSGCTDTVTKNTVVNPLPVADFMAGNVCFGNTMNFSNASTISSGNVVSYNWNFGDLSTSVLQNPSHSYLNAGSYTVLLSVNSDSGCVGSLSKTVVVNPVPAANFTANNACLDDMAVFSNTSTLSSGNIISWYWDFGDSNNSTSQNTSHQYSSDGNYNVALIAISDSGCSDTIFKPVQIYPEPSAAFTLSDVCKYDSAQFTDGSTVSSGNISSFIWDFGDGFNSSLQNPAHLYNAAGNYTIVFTVASNNGCVDSATQSITVFPVPTAVFSTNDVCQYTAAQFTDASTVSSGSLSFFQWDFSDGSNSSAQNPSHNFSSEGTYNVELLVTSDNGCSDSITQPVTIFPVPQADFSFSNKCLYEAVQFTDNTTISSGSVTWNWDFGDGTTSSAPNPSHLYTADGTYNVVLIVISDNNCSDTAMKQDTIHPVPVSDFSFADNCLSDTAGFTDQSTVSGGTITGWNWNFGDGNSSALQDPEHLYSTAGTYSVTLIASSDFGCTDTLTQQIVQFPMPDADFDADSICLNELTFFTDLSTGNGDLIDTWTWVFGDGSSPSSLQNPSHLYASDGSYSVTLLVETTNGCKDYKAISIPVYPLPTANFANDTVCKNEPPTQFNSDLSSGTLVAWDWNFGDNITSSQQNPSHIYQNDGQFSTQLIVTTDKGCKDTVVKQVVVYPLPLFVFSGNKTAGCDPLCVNFNASAVSGSSVTSWLWDMGDGNISALANPSNCYSPDGTYSVQLMATSSDNCRDTLVRQDYITVFPNPIAGFDFSPQSTTILSPEIDFTDLSSGANGWFWDFGDQDTAPYQNPVHQYSDTGTFTVMQIVTNQFQCKDTIFKTVIIKPEFIIYIPNAFSPDGDGINDVFLPEGAGFKNENYALYIFDRWGDLIYETHNAYGFWDGYLNGKPAKQDVYVFRLEVEDFLNAPHRFIGKVTLIGK